MLAGPIVVVFSMFAALERGLKVDGFSGEIRIQHSWGGGGGGTR